MDKIIVIVGPTAVGKTSLSIALAKKFHGEIISGDSMQIYRGLDIGTAKVTPEEMAGIPHHLIDIRAMNESYSAAEFQQEARQAISDIRSRGKIPIIAGGTGLYIQSLIYDYKLGTDEKKAADEPKPIREVYELFAEEHGNEALWQKLVAVDPLAAEKIHFNNRRKVIRALEVFEETGQSILTPKETPEQLYDAYIIGLDTDRPVLYERINARVDKMMTEGLLEEAKRVAAYPDTQASKGIGYKELFDYLSGAESLESAIECIKQNSRRYAKRQLTWFRNRMVVDWYDLVKEPETIEVIEQTVENWLEEGGVNE
ncbi:tRNA (adenosine(37)-N6)-dimethylallyltransferase MiaA [Enterococcus sp. JM4C]|uniref:tRNA (adenosine(37)-N6)-dimethylallyltransferase MiaA n=1 Tax=Candidatus Enterococcus huntleyi TaxID=1857217 RepID=UPI0013794502|nr:tRNA (adenosine(37)-N6)-dimethylallyltransferase MiaA [Enterococcus sp. JM4C]KAF1296167.1 tRNA (adenosine(37)-N6)-dimethylallyltransferase MiaA [Enterococcus sp. JM4C]